MVYYVNNSNTRNGIGTKESPFCTIGEAARIAVAGDEIVVAPGIYREQVDPKHGGTREARIVYRSEVKNAAVITGAERVTSWVRCEGGVWTARIPNSVFGEYNPYTETVGGDWYAVNRDFPVHTGEVYLNGRSIYEAPDFDGVLNPAVSPWSWEHEWSLNRWYTRQDGGDTLLSINIGDLDPNEENVEISVRRCCFCPSLEGRGYITLSGFHICKAATQWAPPTAYQEGMVAPHWSKGWIIEDCEIDESKCSGISLGKYLQPENDNKWSKRFLKDGTQTERDCICQAQREGWSKERIGSHIVRRCNIHNCGQTGIVGHLGCVFSVIEDNHIHHINNKQELTGAEIGGIKLHAAIDVVIRRNHLHHCTRGLWLDWQAQGTRVTQNAFHHNEPAPNITIRGGLAFGEDIFVEVSHGPTLIDNNLMLSSCSGRFSTQGLAVCHNLIAGSLTYVGNGVCNSGCNAPETVRYTPYHVPHRTEIAGFMTILCGDDRYYNNIFVARKPRDDLARWVAANGCGAINRHNLLCGTKPYDGYPTEDMYFSRFNAVSAAGSWSNPSLYYSHLPVYTGGNVFMNGAQPCDIENGAVICDCPVLLTVEEEDGQWVLHTDLYSNLPETRTTVVSTATLGTAFEPEQPFENPDGSPLTLDSDYAGSGRGVNPVPGPFERGIQRFVMG